MPMPRIEYRWTLGNVLTLLALVLQLVVLGGGGLYYAGGLEKRVEAALSAQNEIKATSQIEINNLRRDVQANSNRLQAVEMNYGRMDERLISMQSLLVNIDRKLESYTSRPGLQRNYNQQE